jgi:hypothetical protein
MVSVLTRRVHTRRVLGEYLDIISVPRPGGESYLLYFSSYSSSFLYNYLRSRPNIIKNSKLVL